MQNKKLSINNNFQVIAINIGQNKNVVEKFLNDVPKIDFMILLDENMEIIQFSIRGWHDAFGFLSNMDWLNKLSSLDKKGLSNNHMHPKIILRSDIFR